MYEYQFIHLEYKYCSVCDNVIRMFLLLSQLGLITESLRCKLTN